MARSLVGPPQTPALLDGTRTAFDRCAEPVPGGRGLGAGNGDRAQKVGFATHPGRHFAAVTETAHANPGLVHHASRSEEHTSELQSLMRISYAVFCFTKKKQSIRQYH